MNSVVDKDGASMLRIAFQGSETLSSAVQIIIENELGTRNIEYVPIDEDNFIQFQERCLEEDISVVYIPNDGRYPVDYKFNKGITFITVAINAVLTVPTVPPTETMTRFEL